MEEDCDLVSCLFDLRHRTETLLTAQSQLKIFRPSLLRQTQST